MATTANPIGRWSLLVAAIITVLMIIYWLALGGSGAVAFGMAAVVWAVSAFIYLIYSPMNTVQRTGFMSLIFLAFTAVLLPIFLLENPIFNNNQKIMQYDARLRYASSKYVTYCYQCHGLLGQGINGPQLNNGLAETAGLKGSVPVNKNLDLLTQADLQRIITAGIVDPTDGKFTTYLMPQWGQDYGGPFNTDDVNAMVALIMSSDPTLRAAANAPTDTNGFDYNFSNLTNPSQIAQFNQQKGALSAPKGAAIDLTSQAAVTVPIVKTPTDPTVQWNFIYTDTATGKSSPVIKIKVGTKVTWVNQSGVAHSIHSGTPGSDTGVFTDPIINDGATFDFTFTKPGTYDYYCSFHPAMQAQIIVVA